MAVNRPRRRGACPGRPLRGALALAALLALPAAAQVAAFVVEGDGIPQSLTGKPGSAAAGRALIAARGAANCLECHVIHDKALPAGAKGGSKGPALDGVGAQLTLPQLRLSVVDYARTKANVEMPSFHKAGTLAAGAGDGPRLTAQQIEDVVAYLATLRL